MLAIIIPYYNFNFFEHTLQSLSEQTDKRFKVYIGDDASPKDPRSLLSTLNRTFDYAYHRFEHNIGRQNLVAQWERCIDLSADEPWLMILGDDDVLSPNVVQCFYEHLEPIKQYDIHVVRYATTVIDAKGEEVSSPYTHDTLELSTEAYYKNFKQITRSSLSEYFFSRNAYNTHGFRPYPLGWYADDMAWLEFTNFGYIYTINVAQVFIRTSPFSITGQSDNHKEKYRSAYLFFKDILQYQPKAFTEAQRKAFVIYFEQMVFKLNLLTVTNFSLITGFWLKRLDLSNLLRFTKKFLKRKYNDA